MSTIKGVKVNISFSSGERIRVELLQCLQASPDQFVSGEKLSQHLGISRTMVWKHIQTLRRQGYAVESLPHRGHHLLSCPDSLLPLEIQKRLKTQLIGKPIYSFPRLGSTQDLAFQLAQKGIPEGTLVVAEAQSGARGRLGRSYFSPRGGLWFSIVLRPPFRPQLALPISLMGGIAVAEAVQETTGLSPLLKWPNDVFIREKKVAGILSEMVAEADRLHFVICGIGINANIKKESFPPELDTIATSLQIELGEEISRVELLCQVIEHLESHYHSLLSQGMGAVLQAWRRLPNMLGRQVQMSTEEGTWRGTAVDLDDDGALLVKTKGGSLKQVLAGDVRLLENKEAG